MTLLFSLYFIYS